MVNTWIKPFVSMLISENLSDKEIHEVLCTFPNYDDVIAEEIIEEMRKEVK